MSISPSPEPAELETLRRENRYLKDRNAQIQADLTDLGAEAQRLREELERLHGRPSLHRSNPLSGGQ